MNGLMEYDSQNAILLGIAGVGGGLGARWSDEIRLAVSRWLAIRLALQRSRSDQCGEREKPCGGMGLSDRRLRRQFAVHADCDRWSDVRFHFIRAGVRAGCGDRPLHLTLQISIAGKRRAIGWRSLSHQSRAGGERWQSFPRHAG